METGQFVLKVQAKPVEAKAESTAWDIAVDEVVGEETLALEQQAGMHFWFHIASFYFRPYQPVLQELQEVNTTDDETLLEQTAGFCNLVEVLERLCLDLHWQVQLFEVVSTRRPVAKFFPKHCFVKAFDTEATPVWPLPSRRRRQTKRKKEKSGASDTAASEEVVQVRNFAEAGDAFSVECGGQTGQQHPVSDSEESDSQVSSESAEEDNQEDGGLEQLLEGLEAVLNPDLTFVDPEEPASLEETKSALPTTAGEPVPNSEQRAVIEPASAPAAAEVMQPGQPASSTAVPPPAPSEQGSAVSRGSSMRAPPLYLAAREAAEFVWDLPHGRITYYRQGFFHLSVPAAQSQQMCDDSHSKAWD